MADKAMNVYLNDHLAGATLGSNLAKQIQAQNEGTALGELMGWLAPEIEADRQTLIEVMERLDTSRNPVKRATAWLAEKASRVKLSGQTSGESELSAFMALETLCLGVQGKLCLWTALKKVADRYKPLTSMNLNELIERAQTQHSALERERMAASRPALGLWSRASRAITARARGTSRGSGLNETQLTAEQPIPRERAIEHMAEPSAAIS